MTKTSKILLLVLVFVLVAALFAACVKACQHEYVDGVCVKCGEPEPTGDTSCEHNYVNGVCSKCGTACKHKFENDVCTICHMADANAPHELVWSGLEEVTIPVGDDYDLLQGVTVRDRKHGDLTSEIRVLTEEDEEELEALGVYEDFEEFNHNIAGAYTVYYKVTCKEDAKLSQVKTKDIVVSQLHNVKNGDFAIHNQNGFSGWAFDIPGASGATLEQYDDNGQIVPKFNFPATTGNGWWSAQFYNSVNLVGGKTYRIAITAKSNTGKALAFGFEDKDNGYAMITGCTAFALAETYDTYYSYVTPDKDYINAKAVLYLGYLLDADEVGETGHDVIVKRINIDIVDACPEVQFSGLDNVTLKSGIDTEDFNPLTGVTASQGATDLTSKIQVVGSVPFGVLEATNYTLTYYIPNENGKVALANRTVRVVIEKEHAYDILNGEFKEGPFGDRYWTQDVNQTEGNGKMEVRKVDDGLEITIVNKSSAGWHIQLRQDITLTKDTYYDIEVRAKASVNRTITLELDMGGGASEMALTQDYQVFEYTYAASHDGGTRLGFLLGGGNTDNNGSVITIDYIRIKLSADQTKYKDYELKNSQFKNGAKLWGSEGNVLTAGKNEEGSYLEVKVTNESTTNWQSQLRQDGLVFEAGKTYKMTAVVSSDTAGKLYFEIRNQNANVTLKDTNKTLAVGEKTTIELELTMAETVNSIRVGCLLGELPQNAVVTFYSFAIELVEDAPAA